MNTEKAQLLAEALNNQTQDDWDNQIVPKVEGCEIVAEALEDEDFGNEIAFTVDGDVVVLDYTGGRWVVRGGVFTSSIEKINQVREIRSKGPGLSLHFTDLTDNGRGFNGSQYSSFDAVCSSALHWALPDGPFTFSEALEGVLTCIAEHEIMHDKPWADFDPSVPEESDGLVYVLLVLETERIETWLKELKEAA